MGEDIRDRLHAALKGHATDQRALAGALRTYLGAERAAIYGMHRSGAKGGKVCLALARLADAVVDSVYQWACNPRRGKAAPAPAMSLLALGGYGRGFLNPHSDVDLLILYDHGARPEDDPRISIITHLLWDLGFQVGQSCRTIDDCKTAMRESPQTASSFFDARRVVGDDPLFQAFRRRVLAEYLARHKGEFAAFCLRDTHMRHKACNGSPFLLEPNVKESPGGLRDAQLVSWLQRIQENAPLRNYQFVAGEWPAPMQDAHDFVLRVRTAMHIESGRANDLLDLGTQRALAEALGYREAGGFSPVELFMRDYYRSAAAIFQEARFEMQRSEHSALGGTLSIRGRWRRRLSDGLVATGGRLYTVDRSFFASPGAPQRLMNLFRTAQNMRMEISQALLREIRAHLSIVNDDFRTDKQAARSFLDLFNGQGDVAAALRAMHECGLLDEYIPEFGALNCLVWYRNYHDFTVDEHSLNAVAVLDELRGSNRHEDAFKRKVLLETEQPYLLFLGVLLHDIGKSVSGDHVENGATMAPLIAERLGMGEADSKRLCSLVANHLRMIHTAQSRDLREESVLKPFAAAVGTLADLKALYLLTYADTKAVGRAAWTQWQDTLLQELYERTAILLSDEGTAAAPERGLFERMLPLLSTPALVKAAEEHCALVPERYLIEVSPEDAVEHLRFVEELRQRPVAVSVRQERDVTRLWVSTTDRPARFSQIAGTLSGSGVDIVSAQAYTRRDGIIFDRFHVVDAEGKVISEQEFWNKVERNLADVLEGRATVQDLIRHQQRRVAFKRVIPQPGATRIVVENKSSPHYTVVDVGTWDRIGLLYAISSAISALDLDIHFAKIATKANRAMDVFYVTDKNTGLKIADAHRQRAIERKLHETCETFGM